MNKYKIDPKFLNSLNVETLKNLLSEANSLLKETQDSIKSITDKSNDLFKIIVVANTALIGFIFTMPSSKTIFILSVYFVIIFSFIIGKLYFIIYPKRNVLVGTEPKKILVDQMVQYDINTTEKLFIVVMLQNKQDAIDTNISLHSELLSKYKTNVKLLLILIAVSIVIFGLCRLYLTHVPLSC